MRSAYYITQKLQEQLHLTAIIPTCCLIWAKFLQAQLNCSFCSYRSICAMNLWEYFIVCSASGSSSELCNNLHCGHLKWCLCIFMNLGFWGLSAIHRTQYRTVNCVFYTAQEIRHLSYYDICRFGSYSFLISSKYQFVHFFPISCLFYPFLLLSFAEKRKLSVDHGWGKLGEKDTHSAGYCCFSCLQSSHAEIDIHELYQCSLFIDFPTWIHSSENCAIYYAFHMTEAQ